MQADRTLDPTPSMLAHPCPHSRAPRLFGRALRRRRRSVLVRRHAGVERVHLRTVRKVIADRAVEKVDPAADLNRAGAADAEMILRAFGRNFDGESFIESADDAERRSSDRDGDDRGDAFVNSVKDNVPVDLVIRPSIGAASRVAALQDWVGRERRPHARSEIAPHLRVPQANSRPARGVATQDF
jgi:hypothetical protein